MTTIRWRLAIGVASFAAIVVLTFPAAAGQVSRQVSEIWPNSLAPVGVIWPNGPDFIGDTIWPNLLQIGQDLGQATD